MRYARVCSKTGRGMNNGWVFLDGDFYCKSEADALEKARELGYIDLADSFNGGVSFWTVWTTPTESEDHYTKSGQLIKFVKDTKEKKDLKRIRKYVERELGLLLSVKGKTTDLVRGRALFFAIARATTNSTLGVIGETVRRDHATVLHAEKNVIEEILGMRQYEILYAVYLKNIEEANKSSDYMLLNSELRSALDDYKLEIEHLKTKIESKHREELTENECAYRDLSEEKKAIFDVRASAILKMI